MLARSTVALVMLTASALVSQAQAAAFDDLKGYLASCLRFELKGPNAPRGGPASTRARYALDRCSDDVARLERADGRRLRQDGGISPSTKEVIRSVMGRDSGYTNARY